MRIDQMHYNFKMELDRVASNDRPDLMPWEIDEYLNKAILKFVKLRYNYNDSIKSGFETNQERIEELSSLHIKSPELQPAIIPTYLGNGRYEFRLNDLGNNINGQYFRYLFLTKAIITVQKNNCTKKLDLIAWQIDDKKTAFNASSWNWNRVLGNFGKSLFPTPPTSNATIGDTMDYTANLITGSGTTERYNNDMLKSLYVDATNKYNEIEFDVVDAQISYIKFPNRVFIGGYNHIDKHSPSNSPQVHCDLDDSFHDEIVRLAVGLAQEDLQDQLGVQISNKKILDDYQL